MLKKPLKWLVSSVPNDLARFLSKPQEAILSIPILQSVLKTVVRNANALQPTRPFRRRLWRPFSSAWEKYQARKGIWKRPHPYIDGSTGSTPDPDKAPSA